MRTIKQIETHLLLDAAKRFTTMIDEGDISILSIKRFRARRCLRAVQNELNRRIDAPYSWQIEATKPINVKE